MELYQRLEKETGQGVGWHGCGGLRVGYDDDEVDWLKSIMNVGRLLDLPMELVGPDGVREANPHYNVERDPGCCAHLRRRPRRPLRRDPGDGGGGPRGWARPSNGTTASPASSVRAGGEWNVRTEKADIVADHVVIAAGSFASQVGAWFGLKVPSVASAPPLLRHRHRCRSSPPRRRRSR